MENQALANPARNPRCQPGNVAQLAMRQVQAVAHAVGDAGEPSAY